MYSLHDQLPPLASSGWLSLWRGWFGLRDTLTQSSAMPPAPASLPLANLSSSAFICSCDWEYCLLSPESPTVPLEWVSISIIGTGVGAVLVFVSASLASCSTVTSLSEADTRFVEEPAQREQQLLPMAYIHCSCSLALPQHFSICAVADGLGMGLVWMLSWS